MMHGMQAPQQRHAVADHVHDHEAEIGEQDGQEDQQQEPSQHMPRAARSGGRGRLRRIDRIRGLGRLGHGRDYTAWIAQMALRCRAEGGEGERILGSSCGEPPLLESPSACT